MARELSPFSARRLLTQKLADERNSISRNGSPQTQTDSPSASNGRRRSRSRDSRPSDLTSDHKVQAPPSKPGSAAHDRGASPEPYRRPRESQREKRRDRSPHRRAHSSHDRRRDRSRDDAKREKKRSRSRERRRERSRSRDELKGKRRDRSEDKHSRRRRSRSRDRQRREKSKDRHRSRSPLPHRSRKHQSRSRSASTSPPPKRRRRTRSLSNSRSPSPRRRVKKPLPSQEVSFRGLDDSAQPPSKYGGAPPEKEKPNFKTTGILAKFANRVEGTKISLKYHEPPEARKPSASNRWRIFVFKGDDVVDTIELWQKSCWLFGRTQEVVDYMLEHPSSSGQHAVIQFRYIQKTIEDEFGVKSNRGKVKPYVIDLDSSNGTELNGKPVEASRYFELRDKDVLKFAGSEREYVIMLPPPDEQ